MAINSIIHDYLNLRKVCARYVPHTLTNNQKRLLLEFCHHSLKRFEEGRSRRIFNIITGDESCSYHYDPELKESIRFMVSIRNDKNNRLHPYR